MGQKSGSLMEMIAKSNWKIPSPRINGGHGTSPYSNRGEDTVAMGLDRFAVGAETNRAFGR